MSPKKRSRAGALPRLHFSWAELAEDDVATPDLPAAHTPSLPSASSRLAQALAAPPPELMPTTTTKDAQPLVAMRRDAPISAASRRFDKTAALHAASSQEEKTKSLELFERDISAASSKSTLTSYEKTWTELHVAWFGDQIPVLPLSVDKINAIG